MNGLAHRTAAWLVAVLAAAGTVEAADYLREVKPLLQRRCFTCHGAAKQKSKLRLDTAALMRKGSKDGPVIVPGNSLDSELIARLTAEDDERMPPEGEALTAREIALLRDWIDAGANAPANEKPQPHPRDHWAFKVPQQPPLPAVKNKGWAHSAVDAFVLARMENTGVKPSPAANPRTLIRRLSLDLTGLPPTPAEVDAFINSALRNPNSALETLVDRLLASPAFGERWGRHWLDLARYADSNGYEDDRTRPDAFRFRDWVITAFNDDLPYDQFTLAQLAGDLLPESSYAQKVATGFHRMTLSNDGGADVVEEEFRIIAVKDRVDTVGAVWLGLSLGCAKCHTHKYDPITHREYYQMFAFFNNAEDTTIPAPALPKHFQAEYQRLLKAHNGRLAAEKARLAKYEREVLPAKLARWKASPAMDPVVAKKVDAILAVPPAKRSGSDLVTLLSFLAPIDPEYGEAMGSFILTAGNNRPVPPSTKALVLKAKPRASHVHVRGNFLKLGDPVRPGTPAFLPPLRPRGKSADRLDLARWIAGPRHPLTARVAVNRIWRNLFGRGLVETPDQFGLTGAPPTHPQLLDWLATEFVRRGWSRKQLIRQIVLSASYRQASRPRTDLARVDPDNLLWARQSRLRLEAECVRDSALAVAGLLNRQVGGPSFQPALPAGLLSADTLQSERLMKPTPGPGRHRRGVYINVQRMLLLPMLQAFDVANPNGTCARRDRSTNPLQALTLLNDPVFNEAASALGRRIHAACADDNSRQIRHAFQLCLGRAPDARELAVLQKLMATHTPATGPAACTALARVMINLEEFITRE